MKTCTKCKITKKLSEYHKNKNFKDGLCSHCKDCVKNYRIKNRDSIMKTARKARFKNRVNKAKIDKIYRENNSEKIKTKQREYYLLHQEDIIKKSKQYLKDNKEKAKARQKEYYAKNREKLKDSSRRYRAENIDIVREKERKYRISPMGKAVRKNSHNKRKKSFSGGDLTSTQIKEILENAINCYWCNNKLKNKHIDHYIPLSKGGKHSLENIVVSCPHCNCSKNAKDPLEFAQSLGKLL